MQHFLYSQAAYSKIASVGTIQFEKKRLGENAQNSRLEVQVCGAAACSSFLFSLVTRSSNQLIKWQNHVNCIILPAINIEEILLQVEEQHLYHSFGEATNHPVPQTRCMW